MEILNNVISSQGNQDNPDSQLDSDFAIESQYKDRNELSENSYNSVLEQKPNQKNINTEVEQIRGFSNTQDETLRATLDVNNDAIDYEDKEDDDLKNDDNFLIKEDVLENDEDEDEDEDTSFPRSKSSSFPGI